MMSADTRRDGRDSLGPVASRLLGAVLPPAERGEVIEALAHERRARAAATGHVRAALWLWLQIGASMPTLVRRLWWRGWTGFEPRADRLEAGGHPVESWIIDFRYSIRRLFSRPTYTLLAVVTLALGAGGTAAIVSIVRAVLIQPLPVAHEDRIGVFWFDGAWTEQEFLHFRPHFPGFEGVAAYMPGDETLERPGAPLRLIHGISSSAELFDVLGTKPLIGRTFRPGDDVEGAPPVAVLGYTLWRELGSDPEIVGHQIQLGGAARTVVGVMPAGFWFPTPTTQVWTSASMNPQDRVGNWTLIGRIAPGLTMSAMQAPLAAIARELGKNFTYPDQWNKTRAPSITPLREFVEGDVREDLLATFAAMGLILLIACVNVATLMLGQISSRSSELAIRTALGAGKRRLVQQMICESLAIGVLAGVAGAGIAAASFDVLIRALPLGAFADTARLDWTLFAATGACALLAASLVATIPSLALLRGDLKSSIATERTGGAPGRGGRLESILVIAQIAIAVLLTAGAGLLLRTVTNLRGIDAGLQTETVAVLDATMPAQLSNAERHRVVEQAIEVLQRLPGVKAAAAAERIPLRGPSDNWGMNIPGKPQFHHTVTAFRIITTDYFRVMGIAVRRGRVFVPTDRISRERLVVVNEALAHKYFAGEDPIGRMLQTFDASGERIIGVVANVPENRLTDPPVPARYMLYDQVPMMLPATTLVLSGTTPADVPRLITSARNAVEQGVPQLAVERTQSMTSVLDDAIGAPGRLATLLTLLAALALVLSAVGLYGMISHFVTHRSREYAIRLALGLSPSRIVSQVLARGLRLIAVGAAAGIAVALALTRLTTSLLYGVTPTDAPTLAGAVLVLLATGILAALIPARRASRTDPARALRQP